MTTHRLTFIYTMRREYIPNIITILRLILIGPIVASLVLGRYPAACWLFIIAGLTDAVDGYLARKFQWISRFGAMVDPVADKLLMISTFLTLGFIGVIPWWLIVMVVARDVIIVTGGVIYHFLIGAYEFAPSRISKLNTFLQIILIILLMLHIGFQWLPWSMLNALMIGVFCTSALSLCHYLWVWGWKALYARTQLR